MGGLLHIPQPLLRLVHPCETKTYALLRSSPAPRVGHGCMYVTGTQPQPEHPVRQYPQIAPPLKTPNGNNTTRADDDARRTPTANPLPQPRLVVSRISDATLLQIPRCKISPGILFRSSELTPSNKFTILPHVINSLTQQSEHEHEWLSYPSSQHLTDHPSIHPSTSHQQPLLAYLATTAHQN